MTVGWRATRSGRRVTFDPFLQPAACPKVLRDSRDGVLGFLLDCATPGIQPLYSSRVGTNSSRDTTDLATFTPPTSWNAIPYLVRLAAGKGPRGNVFKWTPQWQTRKKTPRRGGGEPCTTKARDYRQARKNLH